MRMAVTFSGRMRRPRSDGLVMGPTEQHSHSACGPSSFLWMLLQLGFVMTLWDMYGTD